MKLESSEVIVLRQLAEGAFGTVFLVEVLHVNQNNNNNVTKGNTYAMKEIVCQSEDQYKDAALELESLQLFVNHEHIIRLLDWSNIPPNTESIPRRVAMLFPLCSRGTSWDVLLRAGVLSTDSTTPWPYTEKNILYIISCISKALEYMHNKGFSHRDVKPHNILLSDPQYYNSELSGEVEDYRLIGHPLLMDFGSVTTARLQVQTRPQALQIEEDAAVKTSAAYRAPELTSVPYPPFELDERVDSWALGCCLFCLAFGRSPFENDREGVLRLAILNGKYQIPTPLKLPTVTLNSKSKKVVTKLATNGNHVLSLSSTVIDVLLYRMLQVDCQQRPFMQEIAHICDGLLQVSPSNRDDLGV